MANQERFLKRIELEGDFTKLVSQVCEDYTIGEYRSHQIIPFGYEDFNVVIETENGKFFAKFFASSRPLQDCERYIEVVENVLDAGVSHPALHKSSQGHLHTITSGVSDIRLCLMEYINGKTFFELGVKPTQQEGEFLIEQAARVNGVSHKPDFFYDSWAVSNFVNEFEKKKNILAPEDREVIDPLVAEFKGLSVDNLPHALVHGDVISTNVIKDASGKLYIIDFSVSNWYPRIQELAVLLCDLFFDSSSPDLFKERYSCAVAEYQKHIILTKEEIEALPLFARAAHAMHVIGARHERAQGNTEEENSKWLELGRKGLGLPKNFKAVR